MLRTLAHIVAVEHEWVSTLQGVDDIQHQLDEYETLEQVRAFSDQLRPEIESFLQSWGPEKESGKFEASRFGRNFVFPYSEVVSHLIAHEIHHIGQLSVWAREADRQPPSANVIFRGLFG
ncbi:DinB family protein [Paenibacillus ginsengarvi]|uniref:DinB family protein n=1 Tax=Paenibacillus ginsengarvi TaxID=400777 RepID=UPI003B836A46